MATSIGVEYGASSGNPGRGSGEEPEVAETPVARELRFEDDNEPIRHKAEHTMSLVSYLKNIWTTNRDHKRDENVTQQMLKNQRARNAQYDPEIENLIQQQGFPVIYAGVTGVKCRAAEAIILDVYNLRERTWKLKPTPDPDYAASLREQIGFEIYSKVEQDLAEAQQQAEGGEVDQQAIVENSVKEADKLIEAELSVRTERMEKRIRDQMLEGGFFDALNDFVSDLVTLKAGVIKGPIARIRKRKRWVTNPDTDENVMEVLEDAVPEFNRVSPLDLYPSPNSASPNDGSLVEALELRRKDLVALKDQPGYDADAIDRVLRNFSSLRGTVKDVEDDREEREDIERKDYEDGSEFAEDIDGLEFFASVQGLMLKNAGITKQPDGKKLKDLAEYDVNAILIGDELIYCDFNEDPTGKRPYRVAGWEKEAGSFWYKGIPELMQDLQRMCNGAVRSLAYNMGIASGPQIEVDTSRLMPGENITGLTPHRIWQVKNPGRSNSPAIRFNNVDSKASELVSVYDRFAQLADDYTQIPAYSYGNEKIAGAGRTFGGLSALMSSASKGIKRVMLEIHEKVMTPSIKQLFDWNMRFGPDEFKGDVCIEPIGIVALMVKEQLSERRIQFLQTLTNDIDSQIVGVEGRAKAIRDTAESLEMTDLVPSDRDLLDKQEEREASEAQNQQLAQQAQQLEMAKAQMEMRSAQADMEIKKLEMQLRIQEFQLNATKAGQKAQIDQGNLQVKSRKVEAEALKDEAVAMDIGVKNLVDAAQASQEDINNDEEGESSGRPIRGNV